MRKQPWTWFKEESRRHLPFLGKLYLFCHKNECELNFAAEAVSTTETSLILSPLGYWDSQFENRKSEKWRVCLFAWFINLWFLSPSGHLIDPTRQDLFREHYDADSRLHLMRIQWKMCWNQCSHLNLKTFWSDSEDTLNFNITKSLFIGNENGSMHVEWWKRA